MNSAVRSRYMTVVHAGMLAFLLLGRIASMRGLDTAYIACLCVCLSAGHNHELYKNG